MSQNGSRPLIAVEDLVVRYPVARGLGGALARRPKRFVHAVEGVSFTVKRGELVALVGESGCGKTTTAQAVLRLVEPVSGRIEFDGGDITALQTRALRPLRRRMQLIYQDPYESLDPRLSVRAAVEEPLLIHGLGGSKAERREHVREALARVELNPPELFLERYPHELSGGQRQRVAIARALVNEPSILLADEPTGNLDSGTSAEIMQVFADLHGQGQTVVMVTHEADIAAHAARVVTLRDGLVAADQRQAA